jgi:hypothetical protein
MSRSKTCLLWGLTLMSPCAQGQALDSLGTGIEFYSGRVITGSEVRLKRPVLGTWKVLLDSVEFPAKDVRFVRGDTIMWANMVHLRKLTRVPQWAVRSRRGVLSEYTHRRIQVGFANFGSIMFAYQRKDRFYSKNGGPLVRDIRSQMWDLVADDPRSLKYMRSSRRYAWIGAVGILGGVLVAGIATGQTSNKEQRENGPPLGFYVGGVSMWLGGVSYIIARSKVRQSVNTYMRSH